MASGGGRLETWGLCLLEVAFGWTFAGFLRFFRLLLRRIATKFRAYPTVLGIL